MASSLSNLVDNLAEEIHKIKCKYTHDNENCEPKGIKYNDCECCIEYANVKDDLYYTNVYVAIGITRESLIKALRFANTYKFSNHGISKFILLLLKGVYPCEYMDDWEKINENLLLEKEDFYSQLNMEDIIDAD